jgi:hypothetical protein
LAEQAYAYVTLIPVAKGFQSAIAKEMGGAGNIGGKVGAEAGGKFKSSFGGALKGIAAVAGTALATIGVGRFFGDAVEQSSRLGESLNAVSVAYGDASASVIKLGEDAATRLGVSTATFNEAAVRFSAFSERVVGEGGDQAKFIDDITTRATDFASVFNIDVAEALQVFQSGLSGEAEPLKRFGINLLDSEVQAFALANGIGEAGRQLTETEKVQARYGLLLESTSKTAGDFANTSDGLANSQRILAANFENIKAQVGDSLTPAFAELTTALVPVAEQLGGVLGEVLEEVAPIITNIAGQLPSFLEGLLPLIYVGGELAEIFFNLVQALLPFVGELLTLLLPVVTDLAGRFEDFMDMALEPLMLLFYTFLDILTPLIDALFPVMIRLVNALIPVVLELFYAFEPLIMALLPLMIRAIEFLIPILEVVAGIIGEVLVFAINMFMDAIDAVTSVVDIFSGFFENTFGGLGEFFYALINRMISAFEGFTNFMIRGVNFIIDALNRIRVDAPDWVEKLTGFSSFGFNISRLSEISLPRIALAEGGLVTGPTNALVGEAGPEVVIPLERFESMMGLDRPQGAINYYAAPNKSFDAEQELLLAMRRARLVA